MHKIHKAVQSYFEVVTVNNVKEKEVKDIKVLRGYMNIITSNGKPLITKI